MQLSFTAIVYLPIVFALLFLAFRFLKDWQRSKSIEPLLYFFVFALYALVCLTGVLAGTIYAHNPAGIRWMLIVSSYILSFANAFLGCLFIFYRFPKTSLWLGFLSIFVFGIFVSILTSMADIRPELEPSGGIYWGLPFYISILRFFLYFFALAPLFYVLLVQKVKQSVDHDTKMKYIVLVSILFFVLMVVLVDFIIEPIFQTKALLSELAILFLLVLFMIAYFVFMERVVSKSEKRFRRLVEKMSDMICLIDSNGIIDYANPMQSLILGYPWRDIIGNPVLDFVFREDMDSVKEFIFSKSESKTGERLEFRFVHKDGHTIWVETNGFFFLEAAAEHGESAKLVLASRDITERKMAEEKLNKSLKEKKILVSEIYHRVKNNLATVIGLLAVHASMIKDSQAKTVLLDAKNRIFSMALVHQLLYQSEDFSVIDFKEYVEKLVTNLSRVFRISQRVKIHYELDKIFLNIEVAIPCGLIIHELVTNAFKHAFHENENANLFIKAQKIGDNRYQLTVRDDGAGIQQTLERESPDTLGLKLVKSLVQQIDGDLEIKNENGTEVTIAFSDKQDRISD
ncbi:MAG: PAS domain S-box protein [Calditrichaeota bacterium]|nr:PAS domain S-box protein [Calditrichota bacterium]